MVKQPAYIEHGDIATKPAQMYAWDGTKPVRLGSVGDALKTAQTDTDGVQINPSSEESILLLRRIVKLLESNAVVDIANRQKVTLDTSSAGCLVNPGVGVSLLGNPVATAAPGVPATAYPLYIWEMPVDQRWRVTEESHVSYQIGIRNQLAFT